MPSAGRLSLSDAEHAALLGRLLRIPHFAADPDFAEGAADSIAVDIESIRHDRVAARMGLGLGQHVEEDAEHGLHVAYHAHTPLPARVEKARRGRPSDRALRLQLIKTVFACFPPGAATLTRGKRGGSEFESLARFVLELAGERIADVHRECIEAVRQVNIERA